MGKYSVTQRDHTGEETVTRYPGSDLTAANIDAETTQAAALRDAQMDVCRGLLFKTQHTAVISPQTAEPRASDPEAQREEKAVVLYHDSITFKPGRVELGCVDMSKQHPGYPGRFYLRGATGHHTDWGAYVTAFETFVPGPGGNSAVISEIYHIGANT